MNSQTYMLLGWLSILTSGVIYSFERLTNAIVFVGVNVSYEMFFSTRFNVTIWQFVFHYNFVFKPLVLL